MIVPVIDLKNGRVVHGIAGNRRRYAEFTSSRFRYDSARDLADALYSMYRPEYSYIADLDAIERQSRQIRQLKSIMEVPCTWMLDVGVGNMETWKSLQQELAENSNWECIVASESIESIRELERIVEASVKPPIFSIDLRGGTLIGNQEVVRMGSIQLMEECRSMGIQKFVAIDLACVGTGAQEWENTIGSIGFNTQDHFFVGGGIRSPDSIRALSELGCRGVLVSSALHDGSI